MKRHSTVLCVCSVLGMFALFGAGCFGARTDSSAMKGYESGKGKELTNLVAEIASFKGTVILTRAGEEIAVQVGTHLESGDNIKTGEESEASIEFYSGSRAALDEHSELTIEQADIDEKNWKKQVVRLKLEGGRVWSRILKLLDADSEFDVEYKGVIATVRGTAFLVTGVGEGMIVDEFDDVIGIEGSVTGTVSEGFSFNLNTKNPVSDLRSVIHPTPDEVRNDAFIHRQLDLDKEFAARAAAIRQEGGIRDDIQGIGLEAGVLTLNMPGVQHSNFFAVAVTAPSAQSTASPSVIALPTMVQAGGEIQLQANAMFRDATGESSRDVSSEAIWQVSDPSLGVLSPTGLFQAYPDAAGTIDIVARWNDGTHEHSGMIHILVGGEIVVTTEATLEIVP